MWEWKCEKCESEQCEIQMCKGKKCESENVKSVKVKSVKFNVWGKKCEHGKILQVWQFVKQSVESEGRGAWPLGKF